MTEQRSNRERFLDLVFRNVPGLVPVFGELWKAVYDELTYDDERILARIEEATARGEITQTRLLNELLASTGQIHHGALLEAHGAPVLFLPSGRGSRAVERPTGECEP